MPTFIIAGSPPVAEELAQRPCPPPISRSRSVPMLPDNRRATLSQRRWPSFGRRINTNTVTTSDSACFSNPHRRIAQKPGLHRRAVSSLGGFQTPPFAPHTRRRSCTASENLHTSRYAPWTPKCLVGPGFVPSTRPSCVCDNTVSNIAFARCGVGSPPSRDARA
jgi:hypothetical protein